MSRRMTFIPELRKQLTDHLVKQGVHETVVADALRQWDAGGFPLSPQQRGCFAVFEKVQDDIRNQS